MICPECGDEFRDGILECPDCDLPLVYEKPRVSRAPEPDFVSLEVPGGMAELMILKSRLESLGIRFLVQNENLQDFEAGGRLGLGFNPVLGRIEIQVEKERAEEARTLLKEIDHSSALRVDSDDDPQVEEMSDTDRKLKGERKRPSGFGRGFTAGVFLGIALFYGYLQIQAREKAKPEIGRWESDTDGDGVIDMATSSDDGKHFLIRTDKNQDGEWDTWADFVNGEMTARRSDTNFDDKVDSWERFQGGLTSRQEVDSQNDGEPDYWMEFQNGVVHRAVADTNGDGKIDSWESFENGLLRRLKEDTDFDGKPDVTISYWESALVRKDVRPGDIGPVLKRTVYENNQRTEDIYDTDGDGTFDKKIVYNEFELPVEEVDLP